MEESPINTLFQHTKTCLKKHGYRIIKSFTTEGRQDSGVLKVFKNGKYYVAKYQWSETGNFSLENEIRAMKYLTYQLKQPFFVKYRADYYCPEQHSRILVMEYIKGETLKEHVDTYHPIKWWIDLIQQLVIAVYFLESKKITCYDLWEANIILQKIPKNKNLTFKLGNKKITIKHPGFLVRIIDFENMHQYSKHPKVYNAHIGKRDEESKNIKGLLAFTKTFQPGKDLNGILGNLMSNFQYLPDEIRNYLGRIVKSRQDVEFNKYFIMVPNPKTSAKYLISKFFR